MQASSGMRSDLRNPHLGQVSVLSRRTVERTVAPIVAVVMAQPCVARLENPLQ